VWVDLDQIYTTVWPRPDLRSRSRSFWSCENCTFLGLSPPLCHGAQNWWLVVIVWDLDYSLSEPNFEFPSRKAITRVQTSSNVDISRHSNGHISVVRKATVTWLGKLLVLHYCVCWRDLDPIQGQGHRPFELPTIAHNCTFLGLSPPPLSHRAQKWWLVGIVWDLVYSLLEPDFRISF